MFVNKLIIIRLGGIEQVAALVNGAPSTELSAEEATGAEVLCPI
jgi:hypothetical protein